MSWIFGEPPTRGSRFVALFDDGSGAELFVWGDDGHLLDADGDDHGVMDREELDDWLYETGHWCWSALPEGYAVGFGVTTTSARDTRWRFAEMPARGTRFVALRKNGLGAVVFFRTPLGAVVDSDGFRMSAGTSDDDFQLWFVAMGFAFWLPLPDGMQLFFEGQS